MIQQSRGHSSSARSRVAIVGGGCAGLTTAFELTRPEHAGRYEVTVYQMGWRLGGKGASGRGVAGRIEEHGLHLWMGFYENAFRLMRECYAELGRAPDHAVATWQDAFKPAPWVSVTDRLGGDWEAWVAHFPPGPGLPGDPFAKDNPFALGAYLSKALALAVELLRSADARTPVTPGEGGAPTAAPWPWGQPPTTVDGAVRAVEWLLRHGQLATVAAICEATEIVRGGLEVLGRQVPGAALAQGALLQLLESISNAARQKLSQLVEGDVALRRTWQVVDLILAIVRGSLAHGLALSPQGFDAIDDYDWRQWLSLHGACPESLDSGFVRGIYDLAFAYENGDPARPRLSAAAALRGAMRMFFTYRGSLFWRMSAGMGDIVFAPLYEVLKRRGVRFEFFHRLSQLKTSCEPGKRLPHVSALEFDVQAEVKDGNEYQPLVDVRGLPCWPAQPDYGQLVHGEVLKAEGRVFESPWEARIARTQTLVVGRDFDLVVLALGGGAIPAVSQELVERAPRWRLMVEGLHTVATQAFQVWLNEDMASLGWPHPPVNLSGWVEPFDTWADMTHLIPAEDWTVPVAAVAYFCSPLPDPEDGLAGTERAHATDYARVQQSATRCLEQEIRSLWPRACDESGAFRWQLLVAEPEADGAQSIGAERFRTQFWTANVRPSDRYCVALPGNARTRLSPLDLSFDNLTVAGDWTESGLNTGCVESAVMSGLLAAHALSDSPPLEAIIGYDHP